ncbi:hypothetical protein Goshw_010588 [Gossypium schwendimanii]|uniref:Uncharacterized protein n=1 Tax=Gossypium schwendimanii TaxID=34291 RepID=A0A7J9MBD1_GOSSC|nr:hypothetical protein [Gossypium schwendimanii]
MCDLFRSWPENKETTFLVSMVRTSE